MDSELAIMRKDMVEKTPNQSLNAKFISLDEELLLTNDLCVDKSICACSIIAYRFLPKQLAHTIWQSQLQRFPMLASAKIGVLNCIRFFGFSLLCAIISFVF